ncbi:hypothetical protein LTS18_001647 [Coniosporium uncinatum]|uniref:Uncharacterized protein n=1 Tax=Coniosporium uncinatum TaxID=93489 RepID=A0ACC3DEV2_9PEZI|nr:hypothetical protein LTS18_001647 [Coniosporium uncinatum]
MISSQANEIADKEAKKTIACEHVTMALEELGFPDYIPEILKVAQEHKVQQAGRERKENRFKNNDMTEEELTRLQNELFRSATEKFQAGGEQST